VVRALDRSPALAERVFVADQARHGYLAGGEVPPARATELLVAAARDASARLAMEEAVGQYRRALELVGADDRQRATVALQLGMELHHSGERADGWRAFSEAIAACRRVGDPELMARVAITLYRYDRDGNGQLREEIIRAAHCALVGARPAATTIDGLVQELIHRTSVQARRAKDDETLAFSLAARHDAIWGLGTASERQALTEEIEAAARRSADRDLEQYASSLRWVALLEQGDPRYLSQLGAFVALAERYDTPRMSGGAVVDRAIIAGLAGRFDEAETLLDQSSDHGHDHPDFTWMLRHVRWTLMLRQGRFDEADRLVQEFGEPGRAAVRLVDGLTAVERGDGERARRLLAELTAVAPAGGDPADSTADVRADGGTAAPPWSIDRGPRRAGPGAAGPRWDG
jgi:tetratricopeptide (TPR) repeat protein